jgi:hypothetical protein
VRLTDWNIRLNYLAIFKIVASIRSRACRRTRRADLSSIVNSRCTGQQFIEGWQVILRIRDGTTVIVFDRYGCAWSNFSQSSTFRVAANRLPSDAFGIVRSITCPAQGFGTRFGEGVLRRREMSMGGPVKCLKVKDFGAKEVAIVIEVRRFPYCRCSKELRRRAGRDIYTAEQPPTRAKSSQPLLLPLPRRKLQYFPQLCKLQIHSTENQRRSLEEIVESAVTSKFEGSSQRAFHPLRLPR